MILWSGMIERYSQPSEAQMSEILWIEWQKFYPVQIQPIEKDRKSVV